MTPINHHTALVLAFLALCLGASLAEAQRRAEAAGDSEHTEWRLVVPPIDWAFLEILTQAAIEAIPAKRVAALNAFSPIQLERFGELAGSYREDMNPADLSALMAKAAVDLQVPLPDWEAIASFGSRDLCQRHRRSLLANLDETAEGVLPDQREDKRIRAFRIAAGTFRAQLSRCMPTTADLDIGPTPGSLFAVA